MTVLVADSIGVHADDRPPLLSDISLAVDPGETVLLCGGPGSGKTLLAKALAGLLDRREDLRVEGSIHRRGDVGFVFQYPATQLVRRTVRLDVGFGLENRGVDREEIAARVTRYARRFDAEHLLDRSVDELSAGETATVALLGILVTEPDVVILDEPLSTLDYPSTNQVLEALDRLETSGTAVVIAEHDPRDLLVRADRVLRLESGRIADAGPPGEVVGSLYRAGIKLPFATQVAIERGQAPIPLAADGAEDGRP